MITLPLKPTPWPIFRVQTCEKFCSGDSKDTSDGAWQTQRMLSSTRRPDESGLKVLSYSRCLLPQIGTARLSFSFGRFLNKVVGATTAGGVWDPETGAASAPDLTGKEIRIQVSIPGATPEAAPVWKTVFWGTCEYQLDHGQGAAAIPAGERIYHLVDGLERLKRWYPDAHAYYESAGGTRLNVYGNPGYNVTQRGNAVTSGNKESSGVTWKTRSGAIALCHTTAGVGNKWTDKEAVEHLLATSAAAGSPLLKMTGATMHFDQPSPIETNPGEPAFNVLTSACSRGRGNGALGLELIDVGENLKVGLRAWSQLSNSVTYYKPSDSTPVVLFGAQDFGDLVEVDVIGDHRFVDGSLLLGDSNQYECDYNETLGEKIQILSTVSIPDGTLEPAWTTAEATAFRNKPLIERRGMNWFPVYQSYRIKRGFNFKTGNGVATGAKDSCDFYCNDIGEIVSSPTTPVTSMLNTMIMDDLPIFEGYDYELYANERNDGQPESGKPARMRPFFFFKNGTGATVGEEVPVSLTMKVHDDIISIYRTDDQAFGSRYISEAAYPDKSLGTQLEYTATAVTIGLELPHRARMASGDNTDDIRLRYTCGWRCAGARPVCARRQQYLTRRPRRTCAQTLAFRRVVRAFICIRRRGSDQTQRRMVPSLLS
jgi:hypothetical protein